jgi:hypothetical protein
VRLRGFIDRKEHKVSQSSELEEISAALCDFGDFAVSSTAKVAKGG